MQPILKINLSSGKIETFTVPADFVRDYLGGASLAARLLYDSFDPARDALDPDSPLLILNGPLTGTAGPAVGRFVVCGRSPLTGLWGESNVGGFWGPELSKAGFSGVWLTGRAQSPSYISINDDQVAVRDASHVWGLDTYEVQDTLRADTGLAGAHILGIGIAGERQIPFASLLCDHGRAAARTGLGAVMGSKNLKAIVVKGTGVVPVFDAGKFLPLRSEANRTLKNDPVTLVANQLGTASVADYFDYLGEQPKKYFSAGALEGSDNISGAVIAHRYGAGKTACHACVIACGRVVKLDEHDEKRKGPEYETLVGFGPNLGITDFPSITHLGDLCDRYGVDTISMSNTIGLAFLLYEKGILTREDTHGLELNWGNIESARELIHMTMRREGLGVWLAQGARALARHFDCEEEAVQVNGLEVAYHDPRGASGMAVVYATSPRGACHNQSDYFLVEVGQADESIGLQFFDRHAGAEKIANVARHQDLRTVNNALVLCVFANVPPQTMTDLVNAACGFDYTIDDLMRAGERGWNLKRLINLKLGLTRANDTLPKSLLQPLADGGAAGYVIPFEAMMDAYYIARNWDKETGMPTRGKLEDLGLMQLG